MDSRAAFLAQKCIVEFCRVRAGVYWQKLFSEKEFQTALNHSRWRAYPPCYAMVAEMVGGCAAQRPRACASAACPQRSRRSRSSSFANYPVPNGSPETFWEDAADPGARATFRHPGGAPRPVREIPDPLARMVFEAVPIHPDLLTNDYDYIFNFLRMNMLQGA